MSSRSPEPLEAYDAIRTRRVTRNMTTEPVSAEDLQRVVDAARFAPNAGNRHLQPVTPISDATTFRLLRLVSPGMIARPQAAILICIDLERAEEFGFRPDTPGLYIDVGTVAATLLLAAHAVGLASCPVTSFSRSAVHRLLHLRSGLESRMIICLGHAAEAQPPVFGSPLERHGP